MDSTPLQIRQRYRRDSQGERIKDGYQFACTCNCGNKTIYVTMLILIIIATGVSIGFHWNDIFGAGNKEDRTPKICIWNALNYSVVNGLYSKTDAMYSKRHDVSCSTNNNIKYDELYVFRHRLVWYISAIPNNVNASLIKGRCGKNTENLTECNSEWQIPPNVLQKNVTVTSAGHCPQILCDKLYLSFKQYVPDEACHGPFEQKDINLYQSIEPGANVYLYFNPTLFRWVCGEYQDVKKCVDLSVYEGYATKQSWYNAQRLEYKDDDINIPWSKHNNLTIQCVESLTHSPTTPSKFPTKPPTIQPTINPTHTPTKSTKSPTKSPSNSPTKLPTKYPTKLPTKLPTKPPTSKPGTSESGCIASDSFVFSYPYYERKRIEELEVYEKILTYDELNDDYVWDELLVKQHFRKGEYMNNELVPMIEFILENNSTLTTTGNHLLYVNNDGLKRADKAKIGDTFKQFHNGYLINVKVLGINNNINKYPRSLYMYNGNLVINGIAISQFTDRTFNRPFRFIMKYIYSYNIYRCIVYCIARIWNAFSWIFDIVIYGCNILTYSPMQRLYCSVFDMSLYK